MKEYDKFYCNDEEKNFKNKLDLDEDDCEQLVEKEGLNNIFLKILPLKMNKKTKTHKL